MTWSWQGAVAVVVAVPLSLGWAVAVVLAAMDSEPISADASALLATVGGGLVTVIAGFVGAEYGRRTTTSRREENRDTATDSVPAVAHRTTR